MDGWLNRLRYHPWINTRRIRRSWRKRARELRSEIAEINERSLIKMRGTDGDEFQDLRAVALDELRRPEAELYDLEARLETEPLLKQADGFGIEIPPECHKPPATLLALDPTYRRQLRKLISAERFAYWEKRIQLGLAVVGAMTGILGLIVAVLALRLAD